MKRVMLSVLLIAGVVNCSAQPGLTQALALLALAGSNSQAPSKFAFTSNTYTRSISTFTINPSGHMTYTGSLQTTPTTATPRTMVINPSGKFLYVDTLTPYRISIYRVESNSGELTYVGHLATTGAQTLVMDPKGKFLFAADDGNGGVYSIRSYLIDEGTGALTLVGSTNTGAVTDGPQIDPTGRFLYIAAPQDVFTYAIDRQTGAFTKIGSNSTIPDDLPISANADPVKCRAVPNPAGAWVCPVNFREATRLSPAGDFLYVSSGHMIQSTTSIGLTDYDYVMAYSVNPNTGLLSVVGQTAVDPVSYNRLALSLNFDPSGKFAYVTRNGNFPRKMDSYLVNGNGLFTATGSISTDSVLYSVAVNGNGRFLYQPQFNITEHSINETDGSVGVGTPIPGAPAASHQTILLSK